MRLATLTVLAWWLCGAVAASKVMNLPVESKLEVVGEVPVEDPACVEGLMYHDGALYQSNGWYGESAVLRVNVESGVSDKRYDLHERVFAEGLAFVDGVFYQLTYREQKAFLYKENRTGFELIDTRSYRSGEGWGLATDGKLLIMSDSSAELTFIDPQTWREAKRVTVRDAKGEPLAWINELEWVNGRLLANHWLSQELLVINPDSGAIEEYFDVAQLNPPQTPACKCRCGPPTANGIAYDAAGDRLWITGKDWEAYYEVRLTFADGSVVGGGGGSGRSDK